MNAGMSLRIRYIWKLDVCAYSGQGNPERPRSFLIVGLKLRTGSQN